MSNERYRLLVSYYFGEARFDKTRAAELAGYSSKNRDSLKSLAWQLFQHPEVKSLMSQKVNKIEISQDKLLAELLELAEFDWRTEYEQVRTSSDMVMAKAFDTVMRGKVKAIADLLKHSSASNRQQVDSVKAAISEWMTTTNATAAEAEEMFASHVPEDVMREVMAELLAANKENEPEAVENTQTEENNAGL